MTYQEYLRLDQILNSQQLASTATGQIHDEHLFIVTHQTFELWFKQILFELDSVRDLFSSPTVDESKTLIIFTRLGRISTILKLLVDQFAILETMTPHDFMSFRKFLTSASGYQSLQFRLLENKLGVLEENRIIYNQTEYKEAFACEPEREKLEESLREPSLLDVVMRWLERTPGLQPEEFDFWNNFDSAVKHWLDIEFYKPAMKESNPDIKKFKMAAFERQQEIFETILDEEMYESSKKRGEHSFTHLAFQGAMMISLYRDEPRFHQPFQILTVLMDIDSLLTKWRYNHVMLVQRMIGNKFGTGGSSGYQYLRATISDRYKVFLDLFNLSTYLIPRTFIPPLTRNMKRRLSMINSGESFDSSLAALMMRMQDIEDEEDSDANMMSLSMI